MLKDVLVSWIQNYFREAVRRNINSWGYIEAIFKIKYISELEWNIRLVRIKLNKFQDLTLHYTEIFLLYIHVLIYRKNSTKSRDIWILRYTENKNIELASHFRLLLSSFPKSNYISEKRKYIFLIILFIGFCYFHFSWIKRHWKSSEICFWDSIPENKKYLIGLNRLFWYRFLLSAF